MNHVQVDLKALRHNYQKIQAKVGANCQLMAVVKADGYGHGMLEVAEALQGEGAACFGVGTVSEGIRLRESGIEGRIVLLLGSGAEPVDVLIQQQLEPVVSDHNQLAALQDSSAPLSVHLKVDCGMGRLGFSPDEIVQVCKGVGSSPLNIASVMAHFPVADEDIELSQDQAQLFADTVKRIRDLGITPLAHMANSAGILAGLSYHEMARAGLALYGYGLSASFGGQALTLKHVMTVRSRVLQVKEVVAGTGVSYGLTEHTSRDSILAVVAIGYADGFPRALSGRGKVLIGGQFAPIIGRICMNMTVVDVTDIDAACGDEVVVLGRQGENEISATDIGDWAGTIDYEILCNLGNLNSRVFIDS